MRNANGYGTVYKLKGNRRNPWTARITVGKKLSSTGKVYPEYQYLGYYRTRTEANNALAYYHARPKERSTSKRMTLDNLYKRWYNDVLQDAALDKQRRYNYSWEALTALHNVDINDVTIEMIETILHSSGITKTLQSKCKTTLKAIYAYAAKHEWCTTDKSSLMSLISIKGEVKKNRVHQRISKEIIKSIQSDQSDIADLALILIYTGLRNKELVDLTLADIHLDQRYFCVTDAKTPAGVREVPIHVNLLPIFEKWIQRNSGEADAQFIHPLDTKNNYVTQAIFRYRFSCQYKEQFQLHDTRVTFVSRMQEITPPIPPVILKSIVGHKSNDLTIDVYTRIDIKEKIAWIDRLTWIE